MGIASQGPAAATRIFDALLRADTLERQRRLAYLLSTLPNDDEEAWVHALAADDAAAETASDLSQSPSEPDFRHFLIVVALLAVIFKNLCKPNVSSSDE